MRKVPQTYIPFWLEVAAMWSRWIRPTAPLAGTLSTLALFLGGVVWIIGKVLHVQELQGLPMEIAGWVVIAGIGVSLLLLLFVAPWEVYARAKTVLETQLVELQPLKKHRETQREHEEKWLFLYVQLISVGEDNSIQPNMVIVSALTYQVDVESIEIQFVLDRERPNEKWSLNEPVILWPGRNPLTINWLPPKGERWETMVRNAKGKKSANGYGEIWLKLKGRDSRIHMRSESSDCYIA